jgi:hypothetical protein
MSAPWIESRIEAVPAPRATGQNCGSCAKCGVDVVLQAAWRLPDRDYTREIRGSSLGSSSTSIKVALVERTAVLILACRGRGPPRHRGFGCVADALACHCAREILHPVEAGFRMTSMCCVGFRCYGWGLASRARSPALHGQGQNPLAECPRHTGSQPRLVWLRQPCDPGEAVEAGVES